MTEDSDSISEEERSLFRPFTRESLVQIENRIAEHEKQKELERKRLEGEAPVNITKLKLFPKKPKNFHILLCQNSM